LSKKRPGKHLGAYAEEFFTGALALGRDVETTKRVWAMIMSFAGYSFCKGHSASYIQVAQHSCYLRAHYPAEFMAAVLANGGGFYHPFAYVAEAIRMGLSPSPPLPTPAVRPSDRLTVRSPALPTCAPAPASPPPTSARSSRSVPSTRSPAAGPVR